MLKSLKFVGHGLGQLRNFLKMVKVIIATAEKMTEKGHIDARRVKRVLEKDSFLLQLNNCCAQNKHWTLFITLIAFMENLSTTSVLQAIEPWHTFMSADSFHGPRPG